MYNILIRPLIEEDAETSYLWRNDSEIWKYTGKRPMHKVTPEIELDWIKKILSEKSSKRFAILCDNKYVGNVQLTDITDTNAQFHIFIGDKNYWNKGIASLATYKILHYAKYTLKLEEIYLLVNSDNLSAIKSYKKNNFVSTTHQEKDGWLKMYCNLSNLKPAKVSVFMMVYNHAEYLKKSLDGILMQKCNFTYEIVIGEDFSTDNSRIILQDYNYKFPGKFNLLLHNENIGAHKNQELTFKNCSGEYIAVCEGDDYWTDPLKLQKQINFLEDNKDFSICFHNVEEIDIEGNIRSERILKSEFSEKVYTIEDLSKVNFIHTPSVVFRKNYSQLPEFFEFCPIGDYPLHLINAQYGKIKYFPDKMACYRIGSGIWSKQDVKTQILKTVYTITYLIMYFKNNAVVKQNLENQVRLLLEEATVTKKIILDADYKDLYLISKKMYIGNILQLLKIKILSKIWKTN
ncbi:GNAT family N-acetyltransferase [Chryseobacterium sp. Leaf394]|uniref:GNAT family N-acetyltransferase n=1 Tax=Chryseobacterium sp. Leaf394 TaxID=1736361 RepID=UPI0006F37B0C|nr:GNAT family N-acetyltransferase [Chryseobacterium sp. Leaf394]KQS95215.1 hypothetical protein ASG21_17395 [Chryseobacterium sp. Leaf394]